MYAATENHSILTISKWERRHARPVLTMPRTFISARQTFSTIKAQAASCQPQQTYSTLLIKETPEPGAVELAIADVMLFSKNYSRSAIAFTASSQETWP